MTDNITITGDLVVDESAAVQGSGDDDLSWASFTTTAGTPKASAALQNYLFTSAGLNLSQNTGGTFPQVGYQSGFISITTPVDDLMLVSDGSGTPFATSGTGVATGFSDINGHAISLFGGDAGNVVIGKSSTGDVVFVVALDEHLDGSSKVDAAKLYVLQFGAIYHDDPTTVDDVDVQDLASLVYLASATTSTVPYNDFSKVPSGSDNWTIIQPSAGVSDPDILVTALDPSDTVEVSTQGLGEGSQALNHLEGLRIDFVTGGRVVLKSVDNDTVHNDANISYTQHQLGSGGGFSITQVNPAGANTTVNVLVHAYDAGGDYQGVDYKAHVGEQTSVNITTGSIVVHDLANNLVTSGVNVDYSGDTALVTGLKNGYHIDFTTDASMDRFTAQNVTPQTNRSFDLGNISFSVTNTSGENHEIGSKVVFEDDGPTISTTLATQSVAFTANATTGAVSTGAALGADGGTLTIANYYDSDNSDPDLTETLSTDGKTLTYYDTANNPIYRLTLSGTNYTFTVLQNKPSPFSPLDFSGIPPGSPHETLTVPVKTGFTGPDVTFDGLIYTNGTSAIGSANLFTYATNPGAGSTDDDLNANSLGFGEKQNQASQMNQNEGFFATAGDNALSGLSFDIQGIGGVKHVNVEWWTVDDGAVVEYHLDPFDLPSGSNTVHEQVLAGSSFDEIYFRFYYDTKVDTSGVRVLNFASATPNDIPDRTLSFQFQAQDGDLDTVLSNTFFVHVDPFI